MTYLAFNDIKLERTTSVKTTSRVQRAQFGDGYSQVLTDGLNTDVERWSCTTGLLTNEEAYSIESYLLSTRGHAINWISPLRSLSCLPMPPSCRSRTMPIIQMCVGN